MVVLSDCTGAPLWPVCRVFCCHWGAFGGDFRGPGEACRYDDYWNGRADCGWLCHSLRAGRWSDVMWMFYDSYWIWSLDGCFAITYMTWKIRVYYEGRLSCLKWIPSSGPCPNNLASGYQGLSTTVPGRNPRELHHYNMGLQKIMHLVASITFDYGYDKHTRRNQGNA